MATRFSQDIWNKLASYAKGHLLSKFDPTLITGSSEDFAPHLEIPHKGFYLAVENSSQQEVVRAGFLQEECNNVLDSTHRVVDAVYAELTAKNLPAQTVQTGRLHFTTVLDIDFIENGLAWDTNEDGIYFSWGDRYKGIYLPYQIRKMNVTHHEIMSKLCSLVAGVPSNLWRLPEALIWRLTCDSHSQ